MRAEIGEYKGQAMFYDSEKKMFSATVGDVEVTSSIQETLQDRITKALKAAGLFPIDVIEISYHRQPGHITSYDPNTMGGWFIGADGSRHKFWNATDYYIDNPHNREILQAILENRARIGVIEKENEALRKQLTEPFPDYFKAREAANEGQKEQGG